MKILRKIIQLGVLAAVLWVGIGTLYGWSASSVEKYCPLGGLATSYSLVSAQHLSCATSEFNLTLLVSLILLTLIARKAFCSWICPVGAVSEWVGSLSRTIRALIAGERPRKRPKRSRYGILEPPRAVDRSMRWVRLPVLVLVLGFSFTLAELVFRPFCPYYVMFSMHGHDVETWSYGILAAVLGFTVIIPMAWCRYLCPLGGALWPLSVVGRLHIRRVKESCTNCGVCDRACPHSLPISTSERVTSGECTLCMECTQACSKRDVLTLRAGSRVMRPAIIPILLAGAIMVGVTAGSIIAIPSYSQEYHSGSIAEENLRTTTFEIEGVRCVDTARRAAGQLEGMPGVVRFTAYASHRRVEIVYDEDQTDIDAIRKAIEGPMYDEASGKFYFHVFKVVQIDGQEID